MLNISSGLNSVSAIVPHSPGLVVTPPSISTVRSWFFDEHTVSLEHAVDLITEARTFTLRSCCKVVVPRQPEFYVYSVVPKRGNLIAVRRILRHPYIAPLLWLSKHYPDVCLLRDVEGFDGSKTARAFVFSVTVTGDASSFDRDDWNKSNGLYAKNIDDFKKRVEAFFRPDLPKGKHVQFSRVDEAHRSGLLHGHLLMFVPHGLPVYQVQKRRKVVDSVSGLVSFEPMVDRNGLPVLVWRVGSGKGDRALKDALNDMWVSADAGHERNNIDLFGLPNLSCLVDYALKYQFKFFARNDCREVARNWTLGVLSLYGKRGYSFSKSFTSAVCDFVSKQAGVDLRLDTVTSNLRNESTPGFYDSLPEGWRSLFIDVFCDAALRNSGFGKDELGLSFFKSERSPLAVLKDRSYDKFFESSEGVSMITKEALFSSFEGADCASENELFCLPELFSHTKHKFLAVDVETTGVDQYSDSLVGVGIAFEGHSYYFPVGHSTAENVSLDALVSVLNPLLSSPDVLKVFHNAAFDVAMLERHGFNVEFPVFDSMVAAHVWDSSKDHVSLNELALNLLGIADTSSYASLVSGYPDLASVPVEKVGQYCREDVILTLRVMEFLLRLFKSHRSSEGLQNMLDLDMRMVFELLWVESCGVKFDQERSSGLSARFASRLSVLLPEIVAAAGHEFNISSSKQVCDVLYTELKLPVLHRTPGGAPSSDSDALRSLVSLHRLPGLLLEYRRLLKLKRDFVDKLSECAVDDRVYTRYDLVSTSTGRLSSCSPNLQNIPKRSSVDAPEVRRLFVPSSGHFLVRADYSLMELRMAAALSSDLVLLDAFTRGEDLHKKTAAMLFHKDVSLISDSERSIGKTCNFALLYGRGARGFANDFNLDHLDSKISVDDAQQWINRFFDSYSGLHPFFNECIGDARLFGFSETVFGSRRWFDEKFGFEVGSVVAAAEREVKNFVIQGACAVVLKRAMVAIHDEFIAAGLEARLVLSVHDELVFDVPALEVTQVSSIVRRCMENAAGLSIPFPVDLSMCSDWGTSLPAAPEVSVYV